MSSEFEVRNLKFEVNSSKLTVRSLKFEVYATNK